MNIHTITSLSPRMSAGIVLLSESHVSVTSPVNFMSTGMVVLPEAPVSMSHSHHDSIHVHSKCPLMQRCHQRSLVIHCPVSVSCIQQCLLNGAARLDHQSPATSHPQCFTHTHTKCTMRNGATTKGHQSQPRLVNSPFVYITHRRPLPSHTNSPS